MGVKAEKTISEGKEGIVFSTIASGSATAPALFSGAVFSILDAADHHRELEIANGQMKCYDFARELGFDNAGTGAVAMNIHTGVLRVVALFSELVTGDIGIMLNGNIKDEGPRNEIKSMLDQLTDYSRENRRLAA